MGLLEHSNVFGHVAISEPGQAVEYGVDRGVASRLNYLEGLACRLVG
jgi:hypothetical protein